MGGLTTSNQVEAKIQYTPTKCKEKFRMLISFNLLGDKLPSCFYILKTKMFVFFWKILKYDDSLTLSWRRPLSCRNQSIDLQIKSMDWFLYDKGLRHERVKMNFHTKENHMEMEQKTLKQSFPWRRKTNRLWIHKSEIIVHKAYKEIRIYFFEQILWNIRTKRQRKFGRGIHREQLMPKGSLSIPLFHFT